MLTPQEVSGAKLEKAVFGGYDIASVDGFLEQVTKDYTALYRENGILKTKMKVLVDKVEDYRSTEDAMRMALLQAEQTAKDIIAAAEAQRDSLEAETARRRSELMQRLEAEAMDRREELRQSTAREEAALATARRATAEYLDKLRASMAAYAETLDRVYDYVEPLPPAPQEVPTPEPAQGEALSPAEEPPEDGVSQDTADNIAAHIFRSLDSLAEQDAAKEKEDKDYTFTPLPDIDYKHLQFGNNYDPKK